MHFSPSPLSRNEGLDTLINTIFDPSPLLGIIRRLQIRFENYRSSCPTPLIAPGLIVTPEIRYQCEIYLPIDIVSSAFFHLFRTALTYPPILTSSPFHNALSWADVFVAIHPRFQFSTNPARLMEAFLSDQTLLTEFLFTSFLPRRFYGGFARYPGQQRCIQAWLKKRILKSVRCLDAACGTGEDSYELVNLLTESGYCAKDIFCEGWTLEPLEVWAAAKRRFPHDPCREMSFKKHTSWIFEQGYQECIRFRCADLTFPQPANSFDLILCNGLLGGPIINTRRATETVVQHLTALLAPGGMLLAADHFHGGWKQHCPQHVLQAVLTLNGLCPVETEEGIGGLKLYQ